MKKPTDAERIQRALDDLVAKNRAQRKVSASPLAESGLPQGKPGRGLLYAGCGLAVLALHAGGYYWYALRDSRLPVAKANQEVTQAPFETAAPVPTTAPAPNIPATVAAPTDMPRQGVIQHHGRTIVVPASSPGLYTTRVATHATPVQAATSPVTRAPQPPEPAETVTVAEHAEAAEQHAYQHFRYKYKVGSANYAIRSLDIVVHDTEAVPAWNRYRSKGEAGLEYYDGSGFRRTTRRFEVLTEVKNGAAKALEITVK
jgi:hypothetical protein